MKSFQRTLFTNFRVIFCRCALLLAIGFSAQPAHAQAPLPNINEVIGWLTVFNSHNRNAPMDMNVVDAMDKLLQLQKTEAGRNLIKQAAIAAGYSAYSGAGASTAAAATCTEAAGATAGAGTSASGILVPAAGWGIVIVGGLVIGFMSNDLGVNNIQISSDRHAYEVYRNAYHVKQCGKEYVATNPQTDAQKSQAMTVFKNCVSTRTAADMGSYDADNYASNCYMCNVWRLFGY